ncbi:hypothetical protein SDJN03_01041, partial [Cucurbita argyrosperma subsp. sororia]
MYRYIWKSRFFKAGAGKINDDPLAESEECEGPLNSEEFHQKVLSVVLIKVGTNRLLYVEAVAKFEDVEKVRLKIFR